MGRQVFCQVCLLFLEDEERTGRDAPLQPSILREFSDDHTLKTPRALTDQLRLTMARERLSAEVWAHSDADPYWFIQDFLDGLKGKDDRDAVFQLWLFLGGPEGAISDPT